MATAFLLNNLNYDVGRDDPTGVRTLLANSATSFSFLNNEGSATTLTGIGFTYGSDLSDGPVSGTITSVKVTGDGTAVAFQVDGPVPVSALPGDFLVDDEVFYGTLLKGADNFALAGGSTTSDLFGRTVVTGDGLAVSGTVTTAADRFTIGDAAGQFIGDTVFVRTDAVVTAGDDVMTATGTAQLQGDINTVQSGATLRGGDDTLTTGDEGTVNGDVVDMLFGGLLIGGNDTIVAGSESIVNGDAFRLDDFANPMTFVGGNDRITINGTLGATVNGDIDQMIVSAGTGNPNQFRFGSDRITGGNGGDTIHGDARFVASSLIVNFGNDLIIANGGDDMIYGDIAEIGNNTSPLLFRGGNDVIYAGAGDDEIYGYVGNDRLYGQQGDDLIRGQSGNDQLFGAFGDDALFGGEGDDSLFGQAGNDVLDGGAGRDVLDGGGGIDIASYEGEDAAVTVDLLQSGANRGAAALDTFRFIEGVRGTNFADTLVGANTNDVLEGGAGNDLLGGRNGSDMLRGGDGADRLYGSNGFDVLDGGAGADILVGGAQNDAASYESADARVGVLADLLQRGRNTGDAAGDFYSGIENLFGSKGADRLFGDNARNVLVGNGGNDTLVGRGGNDLLVGGDGVDLIGGGAGDDVIRGGEGGDRLFGGAGRDRFVYDEDEAVGFETIVDFRRGQDIVDLSAIDANANVAGNQAFRFVTELTGAAGEITYARGSGTIGVLGADTDGDGQADLGIFFENVFALGPRDLVL